jgi:hypothetical protein
VMSMVNSELHVSIGIVVGRWKLNPTGERVKSRTMDSSYTKKRHSRVDSLGFPFFQYAALP